MPLPGSKVSCDFAHHTQERQKPPKPQSDVEAPFEERNEDRKRKNSA